MLWEKRNVARAPIGITWPYPHAARSVVIRLGLLGPICKRGMPLVFFLAHEACAFTSPAKHKFYVWLRDGMNCGMYLRRWRALRRPCKIE